MLTLGIWRKSSFSGGGQGDACVEVADLGAHIAVRDSKAPERAVVGFPVAAFVPFVGALKTARFPGAR